MKKQYHENKTLWQYMSGGIKCDCGCNVFHHEYDENAEKIHVVCNACDKKIGEIREEYVDVELSKGIWMQENLG